jgi:glycosyltransferase involved in cell wall biosynthesis
MLKISAVVIAYNEEQNIERCLKSLQNVADEIIVVDSFSTDNTLEICKKYGTKIIQHAFEGYVEQKNFALAQTSNTFVLSLDADEELSETLIASIKKAKETHDADGYTMNRLNNYCGKWIYHCGWYPDNKLRLFDKTKGKWGGINPHDKFEMSNGTTTKHLDGDILHYTFNTEEEYINQQKKFAEISATNLFKAGKRSNLFHVYLKPPIKFIRDYFFHRGFLDGNDGLVISRVAAKAMYWKYNRLRQLQRSH